MKVGLCSVYGFFSLMLCLIMMGLKTNRLRAAYAPWALDAKYAKKEKKEN